jgi:hypothetical protein
LTRQVLHLDLKRYMTDPTHRPDSQTTPLRLSPSDENSRAGCAPASAVKSLGWWALILSACAVSGYLRLFTTFAPYDDEGYVMLTLRRFLQGHAMYDTTYSQYGPAYYVLVAPWHWLLKIPVTHDVTRFKTLLIWLTAASAGGMAAGNFTGSRAWARIAAVFSFLHLERLALEPGHPQETCLLALAAVLYLASTLSRQGTASCAALPSASCTGWICFGIGLATATAGLTKANMGLFIAVSLLLGLSRLLKPGKVRLLITVGASTAAILLPWAIARTHSVEWRGSFLPSIILSATIAMLTVPAAAVLRPNARLAVVWFLGGMATAAGCYVAAICLHGTSAWGMAYGVALQHLQFVNVFYEHPPLFSGSIIAALLALIAALVLHHQSAKRPGPGLESAATEPNRLPQPQLRRVLGLAALMLLAGVVVRHAYEIALPIPHGATDRGLAAILVSFFTPFCWLILRKAHGTHDQVTERGTDPGRWLLVPLAILHPLAVYPVPGTQTAIGSWPTLLCLIVLCADLLRDVSLWQSRSDRILATRIKPVLAVGLALVLMARIACQSATYARLEPLQLPGATRLRLDADFVAKQHWLRRQIHEHGTTFLGLPSGYNSLYLWAECAPPSGFNTTMWPDLLSSNEQQKVIDAVAARDDLCVIYETSEPPPVRKDAPLEAYLRTHFEPAATLGTVQVWRRTTP